jgi:hypothetical protein
VSLLIRRDSERRQHRDATSLPANDHLGEADHDVADDALIVHGDE